jgi:sarcosine oxidase/sarcosine oxidase subunit beta
MLPLTADIAALLQGRATQARRVIVVGAGVLGLCAAWALARRGHAVTVLESGPIPHPDASSNDEGRIIRHAYGTMEGYARMMPAAFSAWRALFAETGQDRLVPLRAVYALREASPWEDSVARTQASHGLGYRILPDAELDAIAVLNREGLLRAVEVDGSGMLRAAPILHDLAALLPRLGVALRPRAPVAAVEAGAVRLADGTRLGADAVLACAGPGNLALLPEAGAAAGLRVSLQTLAYLDPPADLAAAWAGAPMLLCRLPGHATGGVYVLPPREGTRLKIGDYASIHDGAALPAAVDPDRLAALLDAGSRALHRFADHRVTAARHCRYVMAPEDRFVLRPALPGAWLASACSGHGFKLAPLLALGLAAAVEERLPPDTLARWAAGHEGETSPGRRSA